MLRAEIIFMLQQYKSHVQAMQLVSGGIIAAGSWVMLNIDPKKDMSIVQWWVSYGLVSMIPILCAYFIFDVLHSLYSMQLCGSRISSIERHISDIVGPNLLIWDSIPTILFRFNKICLADGIGAVNNSVFFHSILTFILFIIVIVVMPCSILYYLLQHHSNMIGDFSARMSIALSTLSTILIAVACTFYGFQSLRKQRRKIDCYIKRLLEENLSARQKNNTAKITVKN